MISFLSCIRTLFLLFFCAFPMNFLLSQEAADFQATHDSATIKGMSIEEFMPGEHGWTIVTTGARIAFSREDQSLRIVQRINGEREIVIIYLSKSTGSMLEKNPVATGFDYVWQEVHVPSNKVIISGDSVIRFYGINQLDVHWLFLPIHYKANDVNGGITALDNEGGVTIMPPEASNRDDYGIVNLVLDGL